MNKFRSFDGEKVIIVMEAEMYERLKEHIDDTGWCPLCGNHSDDHYDGCPFQPEENSARTS